MRSIIGVPLDDNISSALSLDALPFPIMRLEVADGETNISALRAAVETAPGAVDALILTIGSDQRALSEDPIDWERRVRVPLRRAFGVLTGAGRRFRQAGHGVIVVVAPSAAIGPAESSTPELVLLRSIVGMAEALRAELQASPVRVSIVFHDGAGGEDLSTRLTNVMATGPLYSLSADISPERINAYFEPLLDAIEQTSAGPPLPDIGPMAAVYDLVAAGAPSR